MLSKFNTRKVVLCFREKETNKKQKKTGRKKERNRTSLKAVGVIPKARFSSRGVTDP